MSNYKNLMDSLALDEQEEEAWATHLAKAAQAQATPPTKRRRPRAPLLLAAALVAALGVGGIAYANSGFVSLEQFVESLFGASPTSTQLVGSVGRPLNCSDKADGVTVSADALVGDEHSLAMVFSVSREGGLAPMDEKDIASRCLFATWKLDVLGLFGPDGGGMAYFYDADPTDGSIQFVIVWSFDAKASLRGKTVNVHLEDLCMYDERFENLTTIANGAWDLRFTIDYEDATRALSSGGTFETPAGTATVDHLSISPLALTLEYTVDAKPIPGGYAANGSGSTMNASTNEVESEWVADDTTVTLTEYDRDGNATVTTFALPEGPHANDFLNLGTITLSFDNGTTTDMPATNVGGSLNEVENGTRVKTTFLLPCIVDPNQLVGITICGTTLAV